MPAAAKPGSVAQVDSLIDENGSRIDVAENSSLKVAKEMEPVVGGTSPAKGATSG